MGQRDLSPSNNVLPVSGAYKSQWGVNWLIPTLMSTSFLIALAAAIGNHALYASVNGQVPKHQEWVIRAGTALSVSCKTSLALSIGLSFNQCIWKVFRGAFVSLGAVDVLFGATRTPWALLNTELLSKARLALVLAAMVWLTPLIPVFAPGSLTVSLDTTPTVTSLPVSILNFTRINSGLELVSTVTTGAKMVTTSYRGPSKAAVAIAYQAIYQGAIAAASSPCEANCTFTQKFVGPSYECVEVSPEDPNAPWCYDPGSHPNGTCLSSRPASAELYFANSSLVTPSYSNSSWVNDGKLWIKHRYFSPENRYNMSSAADSGDVLTSSHETVAFRCEMWKTTYDIRRSFTNLEQEITGTFTRTEPYDFSTENDAGTLVNPILDVKHFHAETWAAHAIHDAINSFFVGSLTHLQYQGNGQHEWIPHEGLALVGTRFVEEYPWPAPLNHLPVRNLKDLVQQLSVNITLSLFGSPAVTYLQPSQASVETVNSRLVYSYQPLALLTTYGVALALGLLALTVGVVTLLQNGVSMDAGFLSVLATTRNSALDELSRGACLGAAGDGLSKLEKVQVRFGELTSADQTLRRRHAAFGLRGQVRALERGVEYR
ncbi:hypothetical protein QBC43DRAFT_296899 [Cladorrhinum sp. PSN259]|nr:hypothetical protein QBC43DRAFT_296899 [Cladorrhinum sp. PSN259]